MKFGICCGPGSFAPQSADQPQSLLSQLIEVMQEAGADYIEFPVGAVAVEGQPGEWESLLDSFQGSPLKVEAFNSFIPPHHRITGLEVNLSKVLAYAGEALRRCKQLGGAVVVLGSAGARKAPEGFSLAEAEKQFVEFARELGPLAEEIGIDIAIEPLNRKEDNLILSVAHGARLVDEVAHPRIQLLADLYHMDEEGESVEAVGNTGNRLRHTHVADLGRVAPGYADNGETDFTGFFRNLRKVNYDARCSFEGSFSDIAAQSKPLLDLLRRRYRESAA